MYLCFYIPIKAYVACRRLYIPQCHLCRTGTLNLFKHVSIYRLSIFDFPIYHGSQNDRLNSKKGKLLKHCENIEINIINRKKNHP